MDKSKTLSLAQINLKKRTLALSEFLDMAYRNQVDIVAVQEPPTSRGKISGLEQGVRVISYPGTSLENAPECGILVLNPNIVVTKRLDLTNPIISVANIEIGGINFDFISVYAKYSLPIRHLRRRTAYLCSPEIKQRTSGRQF